MDKGKIWLIGGIALVVLIVLVLVFYSPLKGTWAGKAAAPGTLKKVSASTTEIKSKELASQILAKFDALNL